MQQLKSDTYLPEVAETLISEYFHVSKQYAAILIEKSSELADFDIPLLLAPVDSEKVNVSEVSADQKQEIKSIILQSMLACPIGESIRAFLSWRPLFTDIVGVKSLLEFMTLEDTYLFLIQNRPEVRFLCTTDNAEECVVVPAVIAGGEELSKRRLVEALLAFDYSVAAAESIALILADKDYILKKALQDLYKEKGDSEVMKSVLNMAVALPGMLGDSVMLSTSFRILVEILGVRNIEQVFKLAIQVASEVDTSTAFSTTTLLKYLLCSNNNDPKVLHILTPKGKIVKEVQYIPSSLADTNSTLAPYSSVGSEIPTFSTIGNGSEGAANYKVSSALVDATTNSGDQESFIQELLKMEFNYDSDGNRPNVQTAEGTKLANALKHLSSSLYSSDVHFVMELIQNADDNTYAVSLPTLHLQLYPDKVLVYNNEVGFSKKNIQAVCNVGGSTKQGQSGYIGQKGIG